MVTYKSQDTYVVWVTRSPTWDITMIFDDIELWGEVTEFAVNPPVIVLEVFDQDAGVNLLFLLTSYYFSCLSSLGPFVHSCRQIYLKHFLAIFYANSRHVSQLYSFPGVQP